MNNKFKKIASINWVDDFVNKFKSDFEFTSKYSKHDTSEEQKNYMIVCIRRVRQ